MSLRSSCSSSAARVLVAGALVLAPALAAGCGGKSSKEARRDAVNAYITQVNVVTAAAVGERAQINQALLGFSATAATRADIRRLRGVELKLERVARKVRALTPPPEAGRLHGDLVRLIELQATVAGHLAWTAEFVPKLNRTLEPLTAARLRLKRSLSGAKTWQANADAYTGYGNALVPVVQALGRLVPPPELRPTVDQQIRQLGARAREAKALGRAFAEQDAAAVNAALHRLAALSSQDEALRVYRAQRAVTSAYNARLDRIAELAVQVARERQKLAAALG